MSLRAHSTSEGVPLRRHAGENGFSLTELLVVVVIMGVLAVVSLSGFKKRIDQAGSLEVSAMIKAISGAQESYRGENLAYLSVSDDLEDLHPTTSPGKTLYNFWTSTTDPDATSLEGRWRRLAPEIPKPVAFSYATVAGLPAAAGATIDWSTFDSSLAGTSAPTGPWFLIRAVGDINENGVQAVALTSSFNSKIYWENKGE